MGVAYMKIQPGIANQVSGILYFELLKPIFYVGTYVPCIMTLLWIASEVSGI